MLNKILSNLNFNTDYLSLLKEYQQKQAREKVIRGLGFFFVAAAFLVQIFAYTPIASQTSAASSFNDLIPGGVTSRAEVVKDCNNNLHAVATIYGFYGVTCSDIGKASTITLRSTEYNGHLWSLGHLPYGLPGETPVNIDGSTLYWRYLHGWDAPGSYSTYTALKITSENKKTFFILFTCGNLVSINFPPPYTPPIQPPPPPPPPPKPPKVCIYNNVLLASNPLCKPCPNAKDTTDVVSCLVFSKTAANLTQHIANANNTTANPGDEIVYTLSVENTGKSTVKDFVIQENLSDVLEYANLLNGSGATLSSQNILSWPAVNIAPKQIVSKKFDVRVKSPIPDIATNADDPDGYNYIMTNVYGNTVNISVKPPVVVAAVNNVNSTLPNTGPGTSIFIVFIIASVVGYFYSRSRLLNKESLIAETITSEKA